MIAGLIARVPAGRRRRGAGSHAPAARFTIAQWHVCARSTASSSSSLFIAVVIVGQYALDGGFSRQDYTRVAPDDSGEVKIDLGGLPPDDVHFYRFLNRGNQEVRFFVARDRQGVVQVAFDANELCYKLDRGYRHEGDWVTCNKCEKSFRLAEINEGGGGCKPVPLVHRVVGNQLVLLESDILTGWRYFH